MYSDCTEIIQSVKAAADKGIAGSLYDCNLYIIYPVHTDSIYSTTRTRLFQQKYAPAHNYAGADL